MTSPTTSVTVPKAATELFTRKLLALREKCGKVFVGDSPFSGLSQWLLHIVMRGEVITTNGIDEWATAEKLKSPAVYLVVRFK